MSEFGVGKAGSGGTGEFEDTRSDQLPEFEFDRKISRILLRLEDSGLVGDVFPTAENVRAEVTSNGGTAGGIKSACDAIDLLPRCLEGVVLEAVSDRKKSRNPARPALLDRRFEGFARLAAVSGEGKLPLGTIYAESPGEGREMGGEVVPSEEEKCAAVEEADKVLACLAPCPARSVGG